MSIYEFNSYKNFLKKLINENQEERAYQKKLAIAAGCQPSYLSQVLNGKVQITPDQAYGITNFLKFTELETEFFLALVSLERSVQQSFSHFIQKKIEEMRNANLRLTTKIKQTSNPKVLESFANTYYSSWIYIAIHILCTIPGIQSENEICERLGLQRNTVTKVLSELKENGFVKYNQGNWESNLKNIHLADNHTMISRHHSNWRFRAANQLHPISETEIQYTGVYSISKKDMKKIKHILNESIITIRNIAQKSQEEELINVNIDLLQI